MPLFNPWEIKEFVEAERKEISIRDEPFTGLNTVICGVEVKLLSLLLFNRLESIGSPFMLNHRKPRPGDVAVFLWVISTQWVPQNSWLNRWKQKRFYRRLRQIDYEASVAEINDYIDRALYDAPKGTGQRNKQYSSWSATIIHEVASAYGWTADEIMNYPLQALFQNRKWIRFDRMAELGHRPTLSNPSERILREHCEQHLQPGRN